MSHLFEQFSQAELVPIIPPIVEPSPAIAEILVATEDCPPKVHRVKTIEASADCLSHIPPFDAVESPDPSRHGWIRSDCRKCGKFLGYRPQAI